MLRAAPLRRQNRSAACAGDGHLANRPQIARNMAANDLSCPKEKAEVKPLGGATGPVYSTR